MRRYPRRVDHSLLDRALTGDAQLRPMPDSVCVLLREVSAPPRLAAHLRAVHDVAWQLTAGIAELWPQLPFHREEVLGEAPSFVAAWPYLALVRT